MNIEIEILRESQMIFQLANARYLDNLPYVRSVYAHQDYYDALRRVVAIHSERGYDLGYDAAQMKYRVVVTSVLTDLQAQCLQYVYTHVIVPAVSDEVIDARMQRMDSSPPEYTEEQFQAFEAQLNTYCMAREELQNAQFNISKEYFATRKYEGFF